MRIHRSQSLTEQWHTLPTEVRRFIQSLRTNPRPPDALTLPERPGYYQEFIAGHWIGWQVDESTGETIIRVTLSDTE